MKCPTHSSLSRAGAPGPLSVQESSHVTGSFAFAITLAVALFMMSAVAATAQDLTVEKGASAPPSDVAQPVAALLRPDSVKVMAEPTRSSSGG